MLNNINDERFCSEEHRIAFLRASGDADSKNMRKRSLVNPRMRGNQIDIADPTHSADFQFGDFAAAGGQAQPPRNCAAEDFALEVVAPSSAIREAVPSLCSAVAMPAQQVLCGASAPGTNFPHVVTLPAARLPRMPAPIPAGLLPAGLLRAGLLRAGLLRAGLLNDEASRRGFRDRSAGQSDRPKWHRWAALAACFVGIAAATDFLVSRSADRAAAAASQGPAASFEDFSAGFSRWDGAEAGPKPWVLDAGKEAMPNSLALFKPSTGMTDYRLEFSGDVRQNGISWAVRAADHLNYQALEITERKKGSEWQLWFTRYKVVAGKEGPRTQVPLQILLPAQSLWLVRMETVGESSTLWIENQIANSWSDAGATPGGSVGFFAAKGDQYILKKVRITPQ